MKFEFTITHRLPDDQLAAIIAAIRPPEPPPPTPRAKPAKPAREVILDEWLAAQPWEEVKKSHYEALVDVFLGKRDGGHDWPRAKAIAALLSVGAPLGV